MSTTFTVRECLHAYTNEALGTICEEWQLAATSKASRIRAIHKVLGDPLHVKNVGKGLSAEEVRMLKLIVGRGTVSAGDLLSVGGLFSRNQPLHTLQAMAKRGLVLVCPLDGSGAFSFGRLARPWQANDGGPLLIVPELVGMYLPEPQPLGIALPPAAAPKDTPVDGVPDRATAAFLEALRVVELLGPRVTRGNEIHKADENRVLKPGGDAGLSAESLRLSLMIARELGCIEVKGNRLSATRKAEDWAGQGRANRIRDLFQAYLRAEPLPDLKLFYPHLFDALEEHLPPGSVRRTYHRTLVAQVLRELPEDQWCSVDDFAAAVRTLDRNFMFLEERWRAIHTNVRDVTTFWKDRQWQLHEYRLLLWTIQRFLHDLGMVALAEEGGIFRLTPLGRYALGVGSAPSEPSKPHHDALVVQADFEIIAYLDRCPADVRRKLDTFCERVRSGAVSTYRLTQDSVYRGVRSKMPAATFLALLERHAARPVPANVRAQIDTWQRKLETIAMHTCGHVIECVTSDDAAELVSSVPGSRRIGDRFVLVSDATDEVSATIDYRYDRGGKLHQEEGLRFRVPWEKCDLFTRHILDEIGDTEIDAQGDLVFRLSSEKTKKGDDWSLIGAQLEALVEGPLAARYRVALRAWAGDLEAAWSCSATLVRFEDPETCEAAQELPEVARHVEGRLGLFTLVVRKGRLAQFKKELRRHGIIVKPGAAMVDKRPPEDGDERGVQDVEDLAVQSPAREESPVEPEQPEAAHAYTLPSYSASITREILEDAIARRRPVLIEYTSAWSSRPTIRRVDPVTVDVSGASLSGYCHTLEGSRTFKLARIRGIRVLEDETF